MSKDPVLGEIDRLLKKTQKTIHDRTKAYDQSAIGKFQKDTTRFTKFVYTVGKSLRFIYNWSVGPIINLAYKIGKWGFWKYVNAWNRFTYIEDGYGKKIFSKIRGSVMILITAVVLLGITPYLSIAAWEFGGLWGFVWTAERHTVFLNDAQPATSSDGQQIAHTYLAKGCDTKANCNQNDSVAFVIRSTPFNTLYYIVMHGGLYYPDYIAGVIPAVPSKCEALTYGIRQKFLVKNYELYADLLEVQCTPVK